jgi:RimJ/RimL family protein N-acetyltransferase
VFGPYLRGARVTLRPADDSDPPRFVPWFADLEVTRFLGRRSAVALYQEITFLKNIGEAADSVFWMIEADGETVGATGIHAIDWVNAHATTGIVIGAKEKWRTGIATEAMRLRTAYAFRELNLHKLMTEAFVENTGSRRALEKTGYRSVGVRREHFFTGGRWRDVWLGELLREEWVEQPS